MSNSNRTIVDIVSSCACGAVQVEARGPVMSMLLCSCLDCQKASGTGHASVAIIPAQALKIAGNTKSFARPSDSGATFTRHFCPECGTPLFGQSSRAADLRMLPVGLFAGHTEWFTPSQLIFDRSHQAWDLIADHLPRHDTYREANKP